MCIQPRIPTVTFLLVLLNLGFSESILAKSSPNGSWTVMIYAGVDSSSESHVLPHLKDLADESKKGLACEVILFIDRSAEHSDNDTILGENFSDSRLFRLSEVGWQRIPGGKQFPEITLESEFESNSGNADTLAKFIRRAKALAPAKHYALIMFGHGNCRSLCPDESESNEALNERDDSIYSAEITDRLTEKESVDFFWVDVCAYGGIENVYQFREGEERFSAKVMLASPPSSSPAPMAKILTEAGLIGAEGSEPKDAASFGESAIKSIRSYFDKKRFQGYREAWTLFDVAASVKVKQEVDRLAVALAQTDAKSTVEKIRGEGKKPGTLNYMRNRSDTSLMWVVAPHFDLFDLADRMAASDELSQSIRGRSAAVRAAVDEMVIDSFAGSMYKNFQPGQNGAFIVFPDGDSIWREKPQWATFQWYHPEKQTGKRYAYGNFDWCADGAKSGNQVVENWFELLDFWFDKNNNSGGLNSYRF